MSKTLNQLTFFGEDLKRGLALRLKRIEGQVRGLGKMIDENQPCPGVLHQLNATSAALHGVTEVVLRNYFENCVVAAIESGDQHRKTQAVDELMDVLKRFGK